MNILFLTTQFPYPPDNGAKTRTFNLIKGIAKKHNIILISFIKPDEDRGKVTFLKPYCKQIELFEMKKGSKVSFVIDVILNLFSKKPFTIAKYYSFRINRKIKEILDKNKIDLIHCDHLHMAQYAENIDYIPKVVDEHNVELMVIERFLKKEKNIAKKIFVYVFQWLKLRKYEPEICQKFNFCLTVSEIDKKILESKMSKKNIAVIPNGVDIDFFHPMKLEEIPDRLVFVGSMDWFPNEDAMIYFCQKIFPLAKRKIDKLKLFIVGGHPSRQILNLSKMSNDIIVTGYVDDVRPYIAKSSLYIVPIKIGGGTRLKILDALAMGKTVISTKIGCEGIDVSDNEDIVIADTPENFTNKIISLLQNKQLCEKLGKSGRHLVEERYSWGKICGKLYSIYDSLDKKVKKA